MDLDGSLYSPGILGTGKDGEGRGRVPYLFSDPPSVLESILYSDIFVLPVGSTPRETPVPVSFILFTVHGRRRGTQEGGDETSGSRGSEPLVFRSGRV